MNETVRLVKIFQYIAKQQDKSEPLDLYNDWTDVLHAFVRIAAKTYVNEPDNLEVIVKAAQTLGIEV